MRSRFLTGWRTTIVVAAVASFVLLPLSTAFATGPKSDFDAPDSGIRLEKEPVGETPLGRKIRFTRGNYVWPFATGPYYGDVEQAGRKEPGVIRTSVGSYRIKDGLPQIPAELRASNQLAKKGKQYFVVALDREARGFTEVRERIEQLGGAVVAPLPVDAVIARLTPASYNVLLSHPAVIGVDNYHPALKMNPNMGRTPLLDPTKALSEIYDVEIRVFRGEDSKGIAAAVAGLGANIKATYSDTVVAEIHRSKLTEVAQIEGIHKIFEATPIVPFGEETTATTQTGRLNGGPSTGAVPYHDAGVDGGGNGLAAAQTLMILDTGIQVDAGDLADSAALAGTPGGSHRKVRFYGTTTPFGPGDILGDDQGCDTGPKGGFTHGHIVASAAVGAGTRVGPGFGDPFFLKDNNGNAWRVDGVAPGALLVAYDAQLTPAQTSCADPLQDTINTGDLSLAMADGYSRGARIFNFSWGKEEVSYDTNAMDIDDFLVANGDAMIFVAAGNSGIDQTNDFIPDRGTISTPATAKNSLAIGSTRNADDLSPDVPANPIDRRNPESRTPFSGVGPGPDNRIMPQLMLPGSDIGATGIASEYACLTTDNDSLGAAECARRSGQASTSFSTAAASGAALLVRDWFAQGYYPDGRSDDSDNASDQVPNISGALVKSVLIGSAKFMEGIGLVGQRQFGDNLSDRYRFNNEQGYGRIQLDRALPLSTWPVSPSGIIVADGGIVGGKNDLSPGLTGELAAGTTTQTATFNVCDPNQEIKIALTWIDPTGSALVHDLDLEVESPGLRTYLGNYFTDDNDRDGLLDPGEDCDSIGGSTPSGDGVISSAPWSVPACANSITDTENPTEAVFLSPDPLGTGGFSQIETGTWTIRVTGNALAAPQRYAVAIIGGVCNGSAISLDSQEYSCNATAKVTVNEVADGGDPLPSAAEVTDRTVLQVLDGTTVVDEEIGIGFSNVGGGSFESDSLFLSAGTVYDSGNGVLDVQSGNTVRAIYKDESSGTPQANLERVSTAVVDCVTKVGFGNIVFTQFGQDAAFFVVGGCETNARGLFEFGFPDRYLDADESVSFNFAFASTEQQDLTNASLALRCVLADVDSPEDCRPNSADCADPNRDNNPSCDGIPSGNAGDRNLMSILNTPQTIGLIPASQALSANFSIQMANDAAFAAGDPSPEAELILAVTAQTVGKSAEGLAISRQKLNVDEQSFYYSTDFPTGGVEYFDGFGGGATGNDERINGHLGPPGAPLPPLVDDPTPQTDLGNFLADYRFEAYTWSDLTATGKNLALNSPWNFDTTDGGFRTGLSAAADEATIVDPISQWGEDKNFNGTDDKRCTNDIRVACLRDVDCPTSPAPGVCPPGAPDDPSDGIGTCPCQSVEQRDPADGTLNKSWNIRGGCGWVTKAPGTCSNIPSLGCFEDADCFGGTCTGPDPGTGGAWHTGRVGGTTEGTCLANGDNPGQCQSMEVVSGTTGQRTWFELLTTPVIEKVNGPDFKVEFIDFQWNQLIDLPDDNAVWTWEVDTDLSELEPVDLFVDLATLNGLRGGYGAIAAENNPALTDGFSMFSDPCPLAARSLGVGPVTNACNVGTGTSSNNGVLGNSRQAKNSCFFENGAVVGDPLNTLGLPRPFDDDVDNDSDGQIDEFVTANGPKRNMDIFQVNGPDMRFSTLEDIYGDSGETFQAAIGIRNEEKDAPSEPDPAVGFGLAVDDVVVQWREFELVTDTTTCAGSGECAVIDLPSTTVFEGRTLVTISLLEKTPRPINDCNQDCVSPNSPAYDPGCYEGGPVNPRDCDDDGRNDLAVRARSQAEPAGEIVILNETFPGSNEYKGDLALSTLANVPGTLFLAASGSQNPSITVQYRDDEDGTGNICQNSTDPNAQGLVSASSTVILETGAILVIDSALTDNGDNDGFPDTNETVTMRIRVGNTGTADVTGLTARLAANDANVECILSPNIFIGDVPAGGETLSTEGFVFKVADVDRTTLGLTDLDDLTASFNVILNSDQFDVTSAPQSLSINLDLDPSGGSGNTDFFEGFEGASGFGAFTTMNLDFGRASLGGSDGYRCQYHDPDWIASNSYGVITDCFLGGSAAVADAYFWQVHKTSDIDGGRAYSGVQSLYMGIFGAAADEHTTPMANLEAIASAPINLGFQGAAPELSFKHQISLLDSRSVNAPQDNQSADRAVVQYQLADPSSGTPVGDWIKLSPYINIYDQQAVDNFFQCTFDPVDDGNTEDDFFETLDENPGRRSGPSSTCQADGFAADFVFAQIGETFLPFNLNAVGKAQGPGLKGSLGLGTWIESKVTLDSIKGRAIRLRFLTTSLKVGASPNWESIFTFNPDPGDDGWWIDDVSVTNTLVNPATLGNDDKPNTGLPGCGATCTTVSAGLAADPAVVPSPGQVLELSATSSTADACLNGTLQFRFWQDGNGNSAGGDPADTLLRNWTDNPILVIAPNTTETYVADVRCSNLTTCADSQALSVTVTCPSTGAPVSFPTPVLASNKNTLTFPGPARAFGVAIGKLDTLDSSYSSTFSVQGAGTTFDISNVAGGSWILLGGTGLCNDVCFEDAARDAACP